MIELVFPAATWACALSSSVWIFMLSLIKTSSCWELTVVKKINKEKYLKNLTQNSGRRDLYLLINQHHQLVLRAGSGLIINFCIPSLSFLSVQSIYFVIKQNFWGKYLGQIPDWVAPFTFSTIESQSMEVQGEAGRQISRPDRGGKINKNTSSQILVKF